MTSTSEGIFGIDLDGICTFCNPTATVLLGYSDVSDLVGKDLHPLIHAHHADGREYPKKSCRMHLAMKSKGSVRVEDEVLWRADGHAIPVIYRVTPICKANELTGAVITFEEISELLEAQHIMQERLEELEQFNRMSVGRELKMVELKREINTLLRKQRAEEKYKID